MELRFSCINPLTWRCHELEILSVITFLALCEGIHFVTWWIPRTKGQYYWPLLHLHSFLLTHWGRVTHICVSKLASIVSDNGLSPGRRQAIIWTNAEILLIGPLGTNFSEILIEIHTFSFKKMHFKMSSGKWRPFCLGLSVLIYTRYLINSWVAGGLRWHDTHVMPL